MCVALYYPTGTTVSKDTLEKCYKANPHSAGYMYNAGEGVRIERFLEWEPFWKSFKKAKAGNPEADFVVHFRIATSGKKDIPNCHPFEVTSEIGLVHNGVLSCIAGDAKESDTHKFSRILGKILKGNPALWDDTEFWTLVEKMIGTGSKLILLREDGDFKIVNEKAGSWKDGVWFSNTIWETKVYHTPTTQTFTHRSYGYRRIRHSGLPDLCATCGIRYTMYEDMKCATCYELRVLPTAPKVNAPKQEEEYYLAVNPKDADVSTVFTNVRKLYIGGTLYWKHAGRTYEICINDGMYDLVDKYLPTMLEARRIKKTATSIPPGRKATYADFLQTGNSHTSEEG